MSCSVVLSKIFNASKWHIASGTRLKDMQFLVFSPWSPWFIYCMQLVLLGAKKTPDAHCITLALLLWIAIRAMISPTTTITDSVLFTVTNHSNDAKEETAPDPTQPNGGLDAARTDFLTKFTVTVPPAITALTTLDVETRLAAIYQPGLYDVVCGRGKGSYNRPGNVHFRALVASYIVQYQAARTKLDKSTVLGCIVERVHSLTDPTTGQRARFVKKSGSGAWIEIGHEHAREKVGHALREAAAAAAAGQPIPALIMRRSLVETTTVQTKPLHNASTKSMVSIPALPAMVSPAPPPLPLTVAAAALVRNGSMGAIHRQCLPFAPRGILGVDHAPQQPVVLTHLDALETILRMSN
jgi:hypothetical protein